MAKEEKDVKVINFFNYRNRPPQVKYQSKKPSRVQESPLDARSPQELLQKYGMYTDRPALESVQPFYADLTSFDDFETSSNHIRDIKEKFMKLDVDIRAKFNHNPNDFCNYLTSKDFDIKEIMTAEQYAEYSRIENDRLAQQKYQEYLSSDQYKKDLQEQAYREQYEKARYDEWKKSFGGSNK